jgi:hypothetical protein
MDIEDNVALPGGEQTHAPATPAAPAEPAPHETARQTVRQAYEQRKAEAAEREEQKRAPRAAPQTEAPEAAEGTNEGKPLTDRTRQRDAQGRFVEDPELQAQVRVGYNEIQEKGIQGVEAERALNAAKEAEAAKEEPSVALRPPPGWSAAARAQFGLLPPEVKEAVAKREADVAAGMQVLQKYRGLETYTPIIEGSGINHAEFTKRAVEWEQSLRTNPIGTLLHVAKLGNVDIVRLAQQIMQQGGQSQPQMQPQYLPQQQIAGQQAPQPQDFRALIHQELAERDAHSYVDDFLSDPKNIHAEAVADDMALLITNGRADNLEQAYEMACWAHPEIRALLIRQASAPPGAVSETERARRKASEAKAAAKATVGAPSGPRPEQRDTRPPNATVRYDVRRAFEQVRDRDL